MEASGQVTAIGLFGEEWRIASNGPVLVPSLAFHAYVSNPKQEPLNGTLTFLFSENPQPIVMPLMIPPAPGMAGTNLAINIGGIVVNMGQIVVKLSLQADPPIDQEFYLNVRFTPPGQIEQPAQNPN